MAVVDPTSYLYYTWLKLLTLAVLYNVLFIIVRCVYVQQLHLNYQSTLTLTLFDLDLLPVHLADFGLPL